MVIGKWKNYPVLFTKSVYCHLQFRKYKSKGQWEIIAQHSEWQTSKRLETTNVDGDIVLQKYFKNHSPSVG